MRPHPFKRDTPTGPTKERIETVVTRLETVADRLDATTSRLELLVSDLEPDDEDNDDAADLGREPAP